MAQADLTQSDVNLLNVFRSLRGYTGTAQDLADVLGFEKFNCVNLAMGRVGKRLAGVLGEVDPIYSPSTRPDGSTMWWHVPATGEIRDDGFFWWTLRPELAAALSEHGIW